MNDKINNVKQRTFQFQAVIFQIEGQWYGVHILALEEILPLLEIKPVPNGPKFLEGVINLRGDVVPIINLREILGCRRELIPFESRILITAVYSNRVGIIFDEVEDVQQFRPDQVHPAVIDPGKTHFIEEIVKLDSGPMIQMIGIGKLLNDGSIHQWFTFETG